VFGIGGSEFVIIALVALFIFGPDRLPGAAKSAARLLRDVRRWTVRARSELTDTLGPEFENFDLADLNPKRFVQKHLLEGLDDLDLDLDGEKEAARRRAAAESTQSGATAASAPARSGATAASAAEADGGGSLPSGASGADPADGATGPDGSTDAVGSGVRVDTLAVTDSAVAATEGQAPDAAPVRRNPHVDLDAT